MRTEHYSVREACVPASCITQVQLKKYEVKQQLDENGILHSQVVEMTYDDFLDVPFRDYSMQTMVACGEVNRLNYVSPIHSSSLDVLDRISDESEEITARIDHMELMQQVAESAKTETVETKE